MSTDLTTLFPRQPVPRLRTALAGGGTFDLSEERPGTFSLVVFYRGRHCPVCRSYLKSLEERLDDLETRGVSVVAISCDGAERAEAAKSDWQLPRLRIGYGMTLSKAREWGLFASSGRGKTSLGIEEPALFAEPGLFLVRSDGTLYFSSVQTMPFARPHFADILSAVDYVLKHDYPARGEVADVRGVVV
ncbi:MAG: peroxiredoxin-like family protein [Devosia sp.]|nr:peroxiredoxin-like family protein [Devosia sp.]